jgi:hypothetical protein
VNSREIVAAPKQQCWCENWTFIKQLGRTETAEMNFLSSVAGKILYGNKKTEEIREPNTHNLN